MKESINDGKALHCVRRTIEKGIRQRVLQFMCHVGCK